MSVLLSPIGSVNVFHSKAFQGSDLHPTALDGGLGPSKTSMSAKPGGQFSLWTFLEKTAKEIIFEGT
jgi:hypothetical protein